MPGIRNLSSPLRTCRFIAGRRYRHSSSLTTAHRIGTNPALPAAPAPRPISQPGFSQPSFTNQSKTMGWNRSYSSTPALAVSSEENAILNQNPVLPPTPLQITLSEIQTLLEDDVGLDDVWSERLRAAAAGLRTRREGSIAIYGPSSSSPHALLSALLRDPLAEDERTKNAVETRLDGLMGGGDGGVFVNRFGPTLSKGNGSLQCDSPWLRDVSFEVREIITRSPDKALSSLLESDIPIIVIDPIRLLHTPEMQIVLPTLIKNPRLQIIVNGRIGSTSAASASGDSDPMMVQSALREEIVKQISDVCPSYSSSSASATSPKVSFVDSHSALSALDALGSSLESSAKTTREEAFHSFQSLYMASNLGSISQTLLGDIRAVHGAEETGDLQAEGAIIVAGMVLDHIDQNLHSLRNQTDSFLQRIQSLRSQISIIEQELQSTSYTSHENVKEELEKGKLAIGGVLSGRLTWWKVLGWRVDLVRDELEAEVKAKWAVGLVQKLSFEAGQLQAAQRSLSETLPKFSASQSRSTSSIDSSRPLYSPLLQNRLDQVESLTSITPNALLTPLDRRRNQLLNFCVPALHKRGQQLAWTTYPLIFLTSSLSWSATVPLELVSVSTGTGIGLLSGLAIIRWAAGRWKRAEKLFWKDYKRIEEGLEYDLGDDLKGLLKQRVSVKALMAAEGYEALAQARIARLEETEGKIDGLRRQLRVVGNEGH